VAVVASVLLDHVDVHPADLHRSVTARVDDGIVQLSNAGSCTGQLDLALVGRQIMLWIGGIDIFESGVCVCLGAVQIRKLLAGNSPSKPGALHLAHMRTSPSNDRFDGAASKLVGNSAMDARPQIYIPGLGRLSQGHRLAADVEYPSDNVT
jgi:hypothetical protein